MQLHLFPIYQLLWLFFIYAFLGWCTEVAYAALDTGKLVNRGFLNGPLCPIYGCGMAAVLPLLLPLQDNLLILFAGGMLLTTLIELVGGWALKTLFHTTWWDYSDKPFNLGGYICLEFSILWGIGATIMVRVVHPVVMKLVLAIPHKIGLAMLGSMAALFVVDLLATLRVVAGLERDLSELDRIAEALRKGSDRLTEKVGGAALQADEKLDESKETLEAGKLANYEQVVHTGLYSSLRVVGRIVLTPQAKQPFELNADSVEILGDCPADEYPLQKKKMSMEYLRTMPTLRPRTNTFNAAFRVRSVAAYAIHKFFQENGFVYAHSPLITASDCEGAGEMFRVTTLDLDNVPKTENGAVDYSKDFFEKPVNLTVSGQLEAEAMAMAFGKVYTFGPTFRAEKSFTTRHAAEFWMIEPEMAFCDLNGYMDNAEAMIKYVIRYVLDNCPDEMAFFNQFIDKGLVERLELVANSEFGRISYTEAIEILEKNNKKFQYPVEWGVDIQTEHERYLTEVVFKKPVFVTDYPKEIKSFYMKQNADGKTVAAADMLVPGIGELIGGSQREEDYGKLVARMDELGMDKTNYEWYLNLRKFGGVEHAGYGLGFERMIMYLTGIQNIRDVLPFPRTAYGF